MEAFNWTELIPGVGKNTHIATLVVASILMIILSLAGRLALRDSEAAIIPAPKLGIKAIFEAITDFITSMSDMVVGEEGSKFIPFFSALFFFILICNVMGLIPGFTPPTENVNTTFALGIVAFLYYNYFGIREHGFKYIKQFMGPLWFLAPFMMMIELISHIVRPVSLALRLFGNMLGDHTAEGIFLHMLPYYLVPVFFYILGLFFCFIQAFIFMILTMVYVSMAISHEH